MLRKLEGGGTLGGEDNSVGTLLESFFKLEKSDELDFEVVELIASYQGNHDRRLRGQLVRQLFVVGDEMTHIDVTVVLLDQGILRNLITANISR